MRAFTLCALIWRSFVPCVFALSLPGDVQTPRWVAEQIDARDIGRDSRMEMTMRLFDRRGRVRERRLVLTALRGRGSSGDRELVRFLSPGDIKGTALLVWEHDGAEDERFLFLPALGRVRRIAGAEKQESFVGSDLSYEDIGGRELDDYTYAFVERNASWKAPNGHTCAAWQLESIAKDAQVAYPRLVSLVCKDSFIVVAADVFNRRNEREKHYEVRRLEGIDGVWTVMDLVMTNETQKTRTELSVTSVRYNIGLKESDFSRRALEEAMP
ncbi:MAG TPA: outer membrane lipoprotein-sorting protein [Vicinamibacterales bacterium]|nr:outer membrane lipoprotein-sorting protein [Vicinamibacterales bacterium]